jgi:hypothetical protein
MASQGKSETYLSTFKFQRPNLSLDFYLRLRALSVKLVIAATGFFYRTGCGSWSISCAALSEDHMQSEAWGGVVTYLRPGDAAFRLLDGSLRLVRLADGPDMMATDATVSS